MCVNFLDILGVCGRAFRGRAGVRACGRVSYRRAGAHLAGVWACISQACGRVFCGRAGVHLAGRVPRPRRSRYPNRINLNF